MSTVLITGGAGFLGSHLARALDRSGRRVIVHDSAAGAGAPSGVQMVSGDVLDPSHLLRILRRERVDEVVHAAAVVGAPASLERPLHTIRVNVEGSLHVFEACLLADVRRIVDLSSEEVYGTFAAPALDEDAPKAPVSPYGISKHAVEAMAAHYARHYDLPYVAARLSWVYGPGFPRHRLPQPWLVDAAAGRRSVLGSGGDHALDFMHVDDVVAGVQLLLDAPQLRHAAYHVASGAAVTLAELADELRRQVPGWDVELGGALLEQVPGYRAPAKGALRIERIRDELGFTPRLTLAEGLAAELARLRAAAGAGP